MYGMYAPCMCVCLSVHLTGCLHLCETGMDCRDGGVCEVLWSAVDGLETQASWRRSS